MPTSRGRALGRIEEEINQPYWTMHGGETERFSAKTLAGEELRGESIDAQQQALAQYQAMARGEGPSLGRLALQQGAQQTAQQQMAMAAQGRGGNIGALARQAGQAGTSAQMGAASEAAVMQQQEQLAAMQAQGEMSTKMREQAQEQTMGYEGLGFETRTASGQERIEQEKLKLEQEKALEEARRGRWGVAEGAVGMGGKVVGSILGAIFSDPKTKKNISDGRKDVREAIDQIEPVTYSYDDRTGAADTRRLRALGSVSHAPTRRTGVSAADLARTKAGSSVLFRDAEGRLRVDQGHAASLALAGVADVASRLGDLERARGRG